MDMMDMVDRADELSGIYPFGIFFIIPFGKCQLLWERFCRPSILG